LRFEETGMSRAASLSSCAEYETRSKFTGRDGIPTDIAYLDAVIECCRDLEQLCIDIAESCSSAIASASASSIHSSEKLILLNGISSYLEASSRLHRADTETMRLLKLNPSIEDANPLYSVYRSLYLRGVEGNVSVKQKPCRDDEFARRCFELSSRVSLFVTLCNKINVFGYEQLKLVMAERCTARQVVAVDRAMHFYRLLLEGSDTLMQHIAFTPVLRIPPPLHQSVNRHPKTFYSVRKSL